MHIQLHRVYASFGNCCSHSCITCVQLALLFTVIWCISIFMRLTGNSSCLLILCPTFQAKLEDRNQMISENFYFRGDGTVSNPQTLLIQEQRNFCVDCGSQLFYFWATWFAVSLMVLSYPIQSAFYFSEEFLSSLFVRAAFNVVDVNTYCREIENRSRNITMHRYVFRID